MGVQGLADGFLAGFNTADQAVSRNRELGLRDAAQQQQIKDSDRNYGLAQEQVNWRRETDSRDFERQSGRDKEDDRRFGLRNALDQQQLGIQKAGLGMRAQELNMRKDEFNFQRSHAERQQRMQEEMPIIQTLYKQLETTGQVDPQLYGQISKDNPLNPSRFFGQEAINNVMEINRIMPKVLSGEVNYNDPTVLKVMNTVLAPHIARNIGEEDPQTGKKIKSKELNHIGITEDGKNVVPGVKVTYSDGTTANKPMTQFGSADVKDNQVAKIPIEQFMSQVRGYSQMVGQLNQPERAKFIGSMVNPPDKSAMRQETEGYRKELLDISKDEGKQLAALNKDGAMMDEKQLTTARQEIKTNSEQRRQQANQLYGMGGESAQQPPAEQQAEFHAFAEEYQKRVGTMPDPNNEQDREFFTAWKQQQPQKGKVQVQSSAPPAAQREPTSNSNTAQQLREMTRISETRQQ
ncbi:hypothetical protein [Yersinia ruckeri]|uniref:hypothetical protein n=1 Tax=Yersinia ruckeri TaxID=29486 RepID=UPI000BDE69DA|nr:hypothetical protein [Yersinia ruckeri]MCK8538253.1 hypothetical protein [Yersinia ruckeri]MCK8569999.1 hypothetical protein [Yersinia ruckeri]MCK8573918.1 hypothetical protein [Yersinia ruckeri]MCK8576699.1 hypothetical protein [Yersinia ruckeri]MCK8580109.1 hypothetical protein [Yersinia ruckeri]